METRSPTKVRQDEARETGESAGKHATEKVINHLREKHCLTDEERQAFDEGVRQGQNS